MNTSLTVALRTVVVLISALVLQASLFTEVAVAHVHADLMLALALAAGLVGGPQRGAVVGFFSGLLVDLLVFTPYGLSALAFSLVGYVVGALTVGRARRPGWLTAVVGAVGGVVGVLAFASLGELVGQPLLSDPDLVRIAVVQGLCCAVLVPLMALVLRWAWRSPLESRVVLG